MLIEIPKTPVQELFDPLFDQKKIRVLIKREDQNDPLIMGNKYRKLKYNLYEAEKIGADTLLTYGGAFSNHIAATAAAGKKYGFKTIGLIRGEELTKTSNNTLKNASDLGMKLIFLPRPDYQEMKNSLTYPKDLESNLFVIPEGGTNGAAIKGCAELISEIDCYYDILCTPVGTGGTLAGLLKGLQGTKNVWGFSALKGDWIHSSIAKLLELEKVTAPNYQLFTDERFGGYGKYNESLLQFIKQFVETKYIPLEPIYTGKMCFLLWEMIKNDEIAAGLTLLLLHTGGLQGTIGFNQKYSQHLPVL